MNLRKLGPKGGHHFSDVSIEPAEATSRGREVGKWKKSESEEREAVRKERERIKCQERHRSGMHFHVCHGTDTRELGQVSCYRRHVFDNGSFNMILFF